MHTKKFSRITVAFAICIILVMSMTTGALATSSSYTNHYTNGNSSGSFQMTTSSSISQFTVQTQDFPSDSSIVVEVWNSSGTTMLSSYVWLNGNAKISNQPLNYICSAGTYTIKYSVYQGGSGWIGVWLY